MLLLGNRIPKSQTNFNTVTGIQFPVDDLKTIASAAEISAGTRILKHFSHFYPILHVLNYNFEGKYLVSLSGRIDGSSRFGDNNSYGVFPALGLGWVISE